MSSPVLLPSAWHRTRSSRTMQILTFAFLLPAAVIFFPLLRLHRLPFSIPSCRTPGRKDAHVWCDVMTQVLNALPHGCHALIALPPTHAAAPALSRLGSVMYCRPICKWMCLSLCPACVRVHACVCVWNMTDRGAVCAFPCDWSRTWIML